MNVRVRRLDSLSDEDRRMLFDRRPQSEPDVLQTCSEVIDGVRTGGDAAVLTFTKRFDGVSLRAEELRVSAKALENAESALNRDVREAIERAIGNIERFHSMQLVNEDRWMEVEPGVWCGERWTPVETVCLYVPRGRGAFASVACMLGTPARLAGVERIVVCTPPGGDGSVDAATLYACRLLGIDEIYRVGGAQAVAAVAFGTVTIPRCDKIVGPGNVYVSAARRLLGDVIDPGAPAGPSESLIVCDDSPDAGNVARNLLIEAEHGENSTAALVTHSESLAEAVAVELSVQARRLPERRRDFAETVLGDRGGIIVTESLNASIAFANQFAAEHVALMVREPWSVQSKIRNAGEILFGDFPIISLANYGMGMNAIIPTGGSARSYSSVSVRDFQKMTSLGFCTREGFERLRPMVSAMSRDEGFAAHHLAVEQWDDASVEAGVLR